jgi:hypothetical protein
MLISITDATNLLLENLTVAQQVIFPSFYYARNFITLFTKVHHWTLT